jgi:hypothetical protein
VSGYPRLLDGLERRGAETPGLSLIGFLVAVGCAIRLTVAFYLRD